MRINSQEMLLINKRSMKIRNNEPSTNPINEPATTNEEVSSAVSFQGLAASKLTKSPVLKNTAYKAMVALALLAGAGLNQSCTLEMSQYAEFDLKAIKEMFNELLALQKAMLEANNATLEEQKEQTAWLEKIYNEQVALGGTVNDFKTAVVNYMVQDSAIQNQLLEQLKKNGTTEEDALKTLQEIKDLCSQGKYTEAYDKIISILGSIDGTLKDIYSEVKNISEKMDLHHKEYMECQNKTAEILLNIYEQDKGQYSINNEKLDSLIAINSRQENYLLNIEGDVNKLLAIGQDPSRFKELMNAIMESKTEIDYEKFEKIANMIGISIKDLKEEFKANAEKTRVEFVDAINDFKYTYLKTEKEQTAELKEINDKLSILEKFPTLIEDAIANGLDIDLSVLEMAIKENTTAVKENAMISVENSEMIAGKIEELSAKLDKVIDQLNALLKGFERHTNDVNTYNEVYTGKWNQTLDVLGAIAEKLAAGNGDIIKELQDLNNAQNTSNRYLAALLDQNGKVVEKLDSISGMTNGMTIEEFKAYMDEALPNLYKMFVQYSIDTGLDKMPADITELKEAVLFLAEAYPENMKTLSGQMSEIIELLGRLESLDKNSPDYTAILQEISQKLEEYKHNCECDHSGSNTKPNEGILGDLQDKLG